ncbi:MAG: DsbA family protein [Actinomycetota bacterium]|nr:DsbA family protein [Actinomycetota bacterium]
MPATLYFDLGSPFVYLAVERLGCFDFGEVTWRPVSLGALFKATGRSSWGLSPRRADGMAGIEARARAYGLPPIAWPEGWPSNYLQANRACIVAEEQGRLEPFMRAALRVAFVDGRDLGQEDAFLDAARQVGLDRAQVRARIAEPEVKLRLREYTQEAHDAEVIGVPTLRIGGRLFWGDDQLEAAAATIA